jgi:hypothetical protein
MPAQTAQRPEPRQRLCPPRATRLGVEPRNEFKVLLLVIPDPAAAAAGEQRLQTNPLLEHVEVLLNHFVRYRLLANLLEQRAELRPEMLLPDQGEPLAHTVGERSLQHSLHIRHLRIVRDLSVLLQLLDDALAHSRRLPIEQLRLVEDLYRVVVVDSRRKISTAQQIIRP